MDNRKNRFVEAVLTSTHNLCFELKYEKYQNFLSVFFFFFQFLVVKFSVYLNRHVFVMDNIWPGKSFMQIAGTCISVAPH